VALVGPYLSGKTSLLESILHSTGAARRKGRVTQGNTVGDSSQEARARGMSVEVNIATTSFLGDDYTFVDCPGSIEFFQETLNGLQAVDSAVVVCEPEAEKASALAQILRHLADRDIPHLVFVNKIDKATGSIGAVFDALSAVSSKPLILRQIPIREGEAITVYVVLASERAYVYRDGAPSGIVDIPASVSERESAARYSMLEAMSDFDDALMEALLEDETPQPDVIFEDLAREVSRGEIVPVLMGAGEHDNGVFRLLKALRHDTPGLENTVTRLEVDAVPGNVLAQVLKTYQTTRGGKLSVVRVLRGVIKDGATLAGERVSGLFRMVGQHTEKQGSAAAGATVALGRMDNVVTGDTLTPEKETGASLARAPELAPVYALALTAKERSDEVKLSGALAKVIDEDPSISVEHNQDTHQMLVWGQGEIHLRVAAERLNNKYGLAVATEPPRVPYKEAIRKPVTRKARHKKQSGGHGQFGEVVLEIKPLPRGSGFVFDDRITGGVVPKQYIPGVQIGVRDYLQKGPLGFPVVDVSVTLVDGSFHAVDSSDMAFRIAGRMAMAEGMPQCAPVLLEPIIAVTIFAPTEYTARVNALISGKRGQILGFDARQGWPGWDAVNAYMPQAEMADLIVELRSLTQGVGTFDWKYDHLSELTGKLANDVIAAAAE